MCRKDGRSATARTFRQQGCAGMCHYEKETTRSVSYTHLLQRKRVLPCFAKEILHYERQRIHRYTFPFNKRYLLPERYQIPCRHSCLKPLCASARLQQTSRRLMPVSYTHLDVYKRQNISRPKPETSRSISTTIKRACVTWANAAFTLSPTTLCPVSYTHLDVYKRQS